MSIIIIFLVAISLSMDAFSLALIYGTLKFDSKTEKIISISVGIFHFFMPIFGLMFGKIIMSFIPIESNYITGLIFIFLAIEMILSTIKNEEIKEIDNFVSIFFFSLAVSVDSFLIGINIGINNTNILLSSFIFMITSASFTYIGLKLGKKITIKMGNIGTIIGGIILIILGLFYLK